MISKDDSSWTKIENIKQWLYYQQLLNSSDLQSWITKRIKLKKKTSLKHWVFTKRKVTKQYKRNY